MAQGTQQGIVVDISARITGYEESIKQLRAALAQIDPGTELAKSVTKGLQQAESEVRRLGKNLTPRFTSDAQLLKFEDKVNGISTSLGHLGERLHQVTSEDLNPAAVRGLQELEAKIQDVTNRLNTEYESAFKQAITNSSTLTDALSKVGIDINTKGSTEIFDALAEKIQEANQRLKDFSKEYEKAIKAQNGANSRIQSLQSTVFGDSKGRDAATGKVHDIVKDLHLNELKAQITAKLKEQFKDKSDLQAIIDDFFTGLNVNTAKSKLEALMSSLNVQKGDRRDFYEKIFGADKTSNGRDINALIRFLGLPDPSQVQAQLLQYTQQLAAEPKGITGKMRENILGFLSAGDIDNASKTLITAILNAYKSVQNSISTAQTELNAATQQAGAADAGIKQMQAEAQSLNDIQMALRVLETNVQGAGATEAIKILREEFARLNEEIVKLKGDAVNNIKGLSDGAKKSAESFAIGRGEADKYSDALNRVKDREQLVGKIEGIVQRWFSVYAAVRMVTNAIKSVISTVKELDKTITDITIVTSMSREDLWGQMPQYTKMAQDYAVSISGVYQVSQLYYQQGLQTAEVMTLTGETLKMARIAGLDYTEATNYKRKSHVA